MRIDAQIAPFYPPGNLMLGLQILRPHARMKPIDTVVGGRHGFIDIRERYCAQHRAEHPPHKRTRLGSYVQVGSIHGQSSSISKSSLLLSFKKEDSSFLKKRSKKLLFVGV
jgi:hypothetical protein